jgi:hypothetical protein
MGGPEMKKYKTNKLIRMQEFATKLCNQVYDPLIGITPGVLRNIMMILRPHKTDDPEELLRLIDEARWEGKTLWQSFGTAGKWNGRSERLGQLLRTSSVSAKITWLLEGRRIERLLGVLANIEPARIIPKRTARERGWIIYSQECVISDNPARFGYDANGATAEMTTRMTRDLGA